MDSLPTGSDERIYIRTPKVSISIKGKRFCSSVQKTEEQDKDSALKVFCDEPYELYLDQEEQPLYGKTAGNSFFGAYTTVPIFYEQQRYEIVIESLSDSKVEFWHDNFNIRRKITAVGRNRKILSGIINFGNEIGFSDLVIRVNGIDYLRLIIEVFPSKISYKEDYKAIIADITNEVYNLIFDLLKKVYWGFRQNDKSSSSPVEFFAVIRKIYDDFIRAADMILAQPHHQLESIHKVLPSYKIKRVDTQTLRWLTKHPNQIQKIGNHYTANQAMTIQKKVTYETKENRLTKYILQSTAKRLLNLKKNYLRLQRTADQAVVDEIDGMINGINRRCNRGILSEVSAHESSFGMSLTFSMAPGYRDLYKYYLMLLRGLSVTGELFHLSVKDLALLYEYWCFIKLNSLMRNSNKYKLISQNVIKVQGNGLFVALSKGKASQVKYQNLSTLEYITLSYNPKEIDVPTITQRPDNVLKLEKKGTDIQYEYVFDAKYRLNPARPGTDYYQSIGHHPGPEVDDINTMHRYRDAIVYRNGASSYERSMFGAYVLFPYHDEEEYRNHRFYKSISKVNIGGLPFLPSATSMVVDMLDQLITDSPDSAFERATLPRGIEEKLAKVDWSVRDVLIGTLRTRQQLDICLNNKFYHIPQKQLHESDLPIHYVAIYQSIKKFGKDSGIRYYGEVKRCALVQRRQITEIPEDSDELYYRFEIKEWKKLSKPIAAKEIRFVSQLTNKFLLDHSTEIPELKIRSEEEYRLYSELKRSLNSASINDEDNRTSFRFNDFILGFDDGKISISKGQKIFAQYDIEDFSRSPNAVFRRILADMGEH